MFVQEAARQDILDQVAWYAEKGLAAVARRWGTWKGRGSCLAPGAATRLVRCSRMGRKKLTPFDAALW